MNIVLGVDGKRNGDTPPLAISLLRRLRFPKARIDVVHVLTPAPYEDVGMEVGNPNSSYWDEKQAAHESTQVSVNCDAAELSEGESAGAPPVAADHVRPLVVDAPSIAGGLLRQADDQNADLIAVDGSHVQAIGNFLTGSVARALLINSHKHSLLLAKEYHQARGSCQGLITKEVTATTSAPEPAAASADPTWNQDRSVRAVFATDHSPYADQCLETLVRLAPGGIAHLTVLSVYPEANLTGEDSSRWNPTDNRVQGVRKSLLAGNDADIRKLSILLQSSGATCESRVLGGAINETIAQTMEQTEADLLIVGAHGHGYMESLLLGSISFHQAMTAPYSILILRLSQDDRARGDSTTCQKQ